MTRAEGTVRLKATEDERIRGGHVWVYDNEIAGVEGDPADGAVVWVEDHRGRKLGTGFIDRQSVIAVRLLTRGSKRVFSAGDVEGLLAAAFGRRGSLRHDCLRLVNAEGDYMPGLIVDRYGDAVVVQAGLEGWKRTDVSAAVLGGITRLLSPRLLLFKQASGTSRVEGSPPACSPIEDGDPDATVWVREADLEVKVDLVSGQKTGFYIDQRENRKSILPYVDGARVLDCFCYSGIWSCMCAAAGADEVTGVDSSAPALALGRANAERNGLADRVGFEEADVFDYLPGLARAREKYDVIILDPPSLARTRKQVAGAMRGYIHINKVAMGLLRPGGILVTCSCSHHMTRERFMEMLRHTSGLVRRQASVMRVGGQPEDHISLLGAPETDYLKCVSLRIE
ncbi:MAG: class I SAM-dependent rRNA methyltransferase [bacterium]|jgi:23S rRNA (cytosine1962-C5)-methyltransferase